MSSDVIWKTKCLKERWCKESRIAILIQSRKNAFGARHASSTSIISDVFLFDCSIEERCLLQCSIIDL